MYYIVSPVQNHIFNCVTRMYWTGHGRYWSLYLNRAHVYCDPVRARAAISRGRRVHSTAIWTNAEVEKFEQGKE